MAEQSEEDKQKATKIAARTIGKVSADNYHALVSDVLSALTDARADTRKKTWDAAIEILTDYKGLSCSVFNSRYGVSVNELGTDAAIAALKSAKATDGGK